MPRIELSALEQQTTNRSWSAWERESISAQLAQHRRVAAAQARHERAQTRTEHYPLKGGQLLQGQEQAALRRPDETTADRSRDILYRIYTEHKANLPAIVARYFDGATIYQTIGLWQGQTEIGAVVDIIARPSDRARMVSLARDIRDTNGQTSVLLTWQGHNGFQVMNVR